MSLIPTAAELLESPDSPLPSSSALSRGRRRALRWLLAAVAALLAVLLIAGLTVHLAILPHIDDWRAPIEQRASRALGVPVHLGRIEVRSRGWLPSFELREVTLQGPDGSTALRLPHVVAAISLRSLLALEVDFEQLLIESPELDIRRDATGRIFVAGIDCGRPGSDVRPGADNPAADWFFRQHEVIVRGAAVRWSDELRGAPELAFGDVGLVVRNGLRQHALRLDATPPAGWGRRLSISGRFSQPLLARHGDWQRWEGSVYASLPGVDLGRWRRQVDLPSGLSQGSGSLRAWFEVAGGTANAATVDLALTEVTLRLAAGLEPLAFSRVEGRLIGRRDRDGGSLEAQRLAFRTDDGLTWPSSTLKLAWQQHPGATVTGGTFTADRLDVGLMARIASRIPTGDAAGRALAEWRPQGVASAIDARWDGPADLGQAPLHYRIKGRLAGLALASLASPQSGSIGRPGLRNADLQFDASDTGGTAQIAMRGGAIELPGVFEEPLLPLDRLGARLLWKIGTATGQVGTTAPPAFSVQLSDVSFSNADARGQLDARWTSTGADTRTSGPQAVRGTAAPEPASGAARRDLGRLELDGRLSEAAATRVHRYLPLALSPAIRDYVEHAVQAGRLTAASVHIRGDLRDFPFFGSRRGGLPAESGSGRPEGRVSARRPAVSSAGGTGEFRIQAKVDNLSFAYVPGVNGAASRWPLLTGASADLALDHATFSVRNGHGRSGNIEWTKLGGAIEHLDSEGVLTLDASARGPLGDMLGFAEASPIGGWLGHALDKAIGSGSSELKLGLVLPLRHIDTGATVRGSVLLNGNELRATPDSPRLSDTRGRIDFTESGFLLVGASARVYGGEATFEGGSRGNGRSEFIGQGTASAEGLRQAVELGPVSRLASALSGQAGYRASLAFQHGQMELDVGSDLVGLAIDLPAPLAKPAELPLPLHYQTRAQSQTQTQGPMPAQGKLQTPPTLTPSPMRSGAEPAPPAPAASASAPYHELLQVELGNRVQAHYLRENSIGEPARVIRGGIGVYAPVPTPASGVAAQLNLKSVDVDAWQAAFDRLFGAAPERGATPASSAAVAGHVPPLPASHDAGNSAGAAYEPTSIALQADELSTGGRHLTHLTAGLSRVGGAWRANLDAHELAGYVEYRAASGSSAANAAPGRVYARLSRLSLPKGDADQVSTLLDERPASVPALDVVVDDLELNGLRLGRFEIEASNRSSGPTREQAREPVRDWQLTRLAITTPEAQLLGSGLWAATGPTATGASGSPGAAPTAASTRRMVIDFKLNIANSGQLLDRLGTSKVISGGKGELSGQVAWQGSPFAIDYPSLSGQLKLAIDKGQFLKADPGAARLLGVLSLQSLPRRLTLDFRDVFDAGFAFDEIVGDLQIARGVARTNNLRMRGVQAAVLMEGAADIERETEDLRVVVVPEINAGTAALAYAVINPAIGLGAFLAQALLKKPLTAAGTREFHIVGPWADPKVLPVARRLGAAVPTAEPAASGTAGNR